MEETGHHLTSSPRSFILFLLLFGFFYWSSSITLSYMCAMCELRASESVITSGVEREKNVETRT